MRYIIIDTSSILFGFSYNRNVFETVRERFPEYKPLVSKGIARELSRISSNKGERGVKARVALLELKAKKIDVDNISIYPDKWILDKALKNRDCIVVTNDSALARKLALSKVRIYKMSKSGKLRIFNK